ncbi:DegV family protein [Anaerolentibacter hominis]|uniref:DegV family protein n=1 Tax=Anaerolentibacter hominis TaxID=3079009 RepID=UPI0031B86B7B
MGYRIICDSCTDLPKEYKKNEHFEFVPLSIHVDDYTIVDDDTFDQKDFLRRMAASPNCPKSSCPSPEDYMKHFGGEENIYVVTLSAKLSGSYNSAELAKNLYLEENPQKNIYVIDSRSASVGQGLIALKIQELEEAGKGFEKVCVEAIKFRDEMGTKFVLETLESLRKNGRLSNITAIIASALNIKPVMTATPEGEIDKKTQGRGMKKALALMAKAVKEDAVDPENRTVGIAHCNNYERALYMKELLLSEVKFKDVIIVDTAGISSLYANDGGIIVCY